MHLQDLVQLGVLRQAAATLLLTALALTFGVVPGPIGARVRGAVAWSLSHDVNLTRWELWAEERGRDLGLALGVDLGPALSGAPVAAPASHAPALAGVSGELPTSMGFLAPPVAGPVASWFGWREEAGRPEFHQGLDFRGQAGDPVGAIAAGTVERVGDEPSGYGLFVLVAHKGGWESLYAHCAVVPVHSGEPLVQGQSVCRLGSTGRPEGPGPLLHFELRRQGQAIDPAPYLGMAAPASR